MKSTQKVKNLFEALHNKPLILLQIIVIASHLPAPDRYWLLHSAASF